MLVHSRYQSCFIREIQYKALIINLFSSYVDLSSSYLSRRDALTLLFSFKQTLNRSLTARQTRANPGILFGRLNILNH